MRFTTLAAALVAPLLVTAAPTMHKRASNNDKTVLKFAEILEQLETEFYKEALAKFTDPKNFTDAGIAVPEVAIQNFRAILSHEDAHTKFLDAALDAVGDKPITGCKFNFDSALKDVKTMATVARVVEAVGVGAYLGGSTIVDDKSILTAAASILTIEARHQSFLNVINGASGIPQPFDIALTPQQVLALAGGFIQECDVQGALNVTANDPLMITNKDPVAPGTLLTFDKGDDSSSCQMLVGDGNSTALSFPIKDCTVPSGINGPVAIFLTKDPSPLPADINKQNATLIIAGPTIVFLDTQSDALGALARSGKPVQSSDQITPDQASAALSQASGSITTGTSTATDSSSATTSDSTSSPTAAQDNSAPTSSSAPAPAVAVIGVSNIPA
jgi:hypothetical protein